MAYGSKSGYGGGSKSGPKSGVQKTKGMSGGSGRFVHDSKVDSSQGSHDKGVNRNTGSASRSA